MSKTTIKYETKEIARNIYELASAKVNPKETVIQVIENELKIAYVEGEKNKLQEIIWS